MMVRAFKNIVIGFCVLFLAWVAVSTLQIALRVDATQPATTVWNYYNVMF